MTRLFQLREQIEIERNHLIREAEEEKLKGIANRMNAIKMENDKWLAKLENRKIKSLKRAYSGKTQTDLTKVFMKTIRRVVRKAKRKLDPERSEDILRKLDMLTEENVSLCVTRALRELRLFDIAISAHRAIIETSKLLRIIIFTVNVVLFYQFLYFFLIYKLIKLRNLTRISPEDHIFIDSLSNP